MRIAALILGLFAGLGHIVVGRALKGAIFGALFIICLNGLLLGGMVLMGTIATTVFWSSVGCTIAVWVIAYRDLVLSLSARSGVRGQSPKRLGPVGLSKRNGFGAGSPVAGGKGQDARS